MQKKFFMQKTSIESFNLAQENEIRSYYKEHGYVIIKNLIPSKQIDSLIDEYEEIKNNPLFIYYSQATHRCRKIETNEYNLIKDSMQNVSRQVFFRSFSKAIKNCLYHGNISKVLSIIDGSQKHISWQNMFFDLSTGTLEHQDSWYLDTDPPGRLIGAWYSLEDIYKESGTFFVVPYSHKVGILSRDQYPNHDDFIIAVRDKIAQKNLEVTSMPLSKGSVLFWHPFLIHGSFSNVNPRFSRKSLTSHFYPLGANYKSTKGKIKAEKQKLKPTFNSDIYTVYGYSDYAYNLILYGLYFKNIMTSNFKPKIDMRRKS